MKKILFFALAVSVAFAACGKEPKPVIPDGGDPDPDPDPDPITAEYVRVDETPDDWSGEYLLVYEAQAAGANTYGGTTVLQFDGSADPPKDAAGNVVVLSPETPGSAEDLAEITGGEIARADGEVAVSGGRIEADETNDMCRLIIAAVEGGGYSIRTTSGYYLGGGGGSGELSASRTVVPSTHVHTITIGDSDSNVSGNADVVFRNCALIVSGAASNNALRVNAGTGRFGYWGLITASGLWGQHPVALYKRNLPAPVSQESFSVTTTAMTIGAKAGNANIQVTGNVAWSAAITSGTGATISSGGSGTGNGTVTAAFTENESDSPRTVKITVSTDAAVAVKSFEVTVTQRAAGTDPVSLHPRYVRIVALGDPGPSGDWKGTWMLSRERRPEFVRDYYAEDVLEWIEDLKPHCLERFISGYQGSTLIPTRDGGAMSVTEFLNKAILAGGEGCHICPKLDLTWLRGAPGTNNYRNFWEGAQKLYDMELVTPIRSISLDCWNNYKENLEEQGLTTAAQQAPVMQEMFDKLRAIGFEEIGVNLTGANSWGPSANVLDFVNFNINTTEWTPNLSTGIKNNSAIRKTSGKHDTYLLYIDYPGPYERFVEGLTPDQMADVYTKNIWPQQAVQGFVFVYSLSNAGWDPFAHVTSTEGSYGGKNMYDITKECLFRTE